MEKIKVVAYARYSSDNQREESIDAQLRAIEDYCKKYNYTIIKTYIDKAKSGTTDKRPEFQQMIKDSDNKDFDYVIVHKLDRFSRDKYDAVTYKRKLKNNGIRVVSVVENFDESPESAILESLMEGMAEYYQKNLAREVMKGLRENAYQGKHTGGIPPLGYDVAEDKTYVLNPTEAEAVKLIYEMTLKNKTSNEIIRELNVRGYKTKKGADWSKYSLTSILRNEKYTGVLVFNRASSKDVYGKRNNHKSKDEAEIIKTEGVLPVIISKEIFAEVQEKLQSRKTSPLRETKQSYLLTGLIKCECGFHMHGNIRQSGKKNGSRYVSYRCGCRTKKGPEKCDNKEIRKEYVEEFILNELEQVVFNQKSIEKLVEKANLYLQEENQLIFLTKEKLGKNKDEVNSKIKNLIDAIAQGITSQEVKDKLNALTTEKDLIDSQLNEIDKQINSSCSITAEDIEERLKNLSTFVRERNIPEVKKFIRSFVKEIIVTKTDIRVGLSPLYLFFDKYIKCNKESLIQRNDLYIPLKRCMSIKI